MISNEFVVGDYYELLALHRALLEAKFCDEPNDLDVSVSPIVAKLHKRVICSLIDIEMKQKGKSTKEEWHDWLNLDPERREWKVGLQRTRSERLWEKWDDQKKKEYVYNLLSPFTIDDELACNFISQV